MKGIEPSYAAWEAAVLPLNYTRGCDGVAAKSNEASDLNQRLLPGNHVIGRFGSLLVHVFHVLRGRADLAVFANGQHYYAEVRTAFAGEIGVNLGDIDLVVVVGIHSHCILKAPGIEKAADLFCVRSRVVIVRGVQETAFGRFWIADRLAFEEDDLAGVCEVILGIGITREIAQRVEKRAVIELYAHAVHETLVAGESIVGLIVIVIAARAGLLGLIVVRRKRGIFGVLGVVGFYGRDDALFIRFRLGLFRGFLHCPDGREKQGHEDRNNRDDGEEFDQGKGRSPSAPESTCVHFSKGKSFPGNYWSRAD